MKKSVTIAAVVLAASAMLAGCASDGGGLFSSSLTTQAVNNTPNQAIPVANSNAVTPPANPICTTLSAQINTLRAEGVVERAAKVAEGKTSTVNVKRSSLGNLTKLDQLNREYQANCSIALPTPTTAQPTVTPGPVQNTATVVPR